MGTTFGTNLIRAFEAGRKAKEGREEKEREAEERKLRLALLKQQQDRLKHEQAVSDFQAKWNFKQGQPADKLPGADFGSQESTIPGGVPIRARLEELALPNQPMAVPEQLGGGVATPQTAEQLFKRKLMEFEQQKQVEQSYQKPTTQFAPAGSIPITTSPTGQVTRGEPIPDKPLAPDRSITPYEDFRAKGGTPEAWLKLEGAKTGTTTSLNTPFKLWLKDNPQGTHAQWMKTQAEAVKAKKQLPASVKDKLSKFEATEKRLSSIWERAGKNPKWVGTIWSGNPAALRRMAEKRGTLSAEESLFRKEVQNDLTREMKELYGAALTPTELANAMKTLPNADDMSPPEFSGAVEAQLQWIKGQKEALVRQYDMVNSATSGSAGGDLSGLSDEELLEIIRQ